MSIKSLLTIVVVLAVAVVSADLAAAAERRRTTIDKDATKDDIVRSLTPTSVGQTTAVSISAPVAFALNSARLTGGAKRLLDHVAAALASPKLSQYRFVIEGHTDASGSADINRKLSKHRAESVYSYLALQGVDISRLKAVGHGESRPLPGVDPSNARNRRVEIVRMPRTKTR